MLPSWSALDHGDWQSIAESLESVIPANAGIQGPAPDASYILPIVDHNDTTQCNGRHRTKDLILAWMNTLAAGTTDARTAA